MTALAEPLSLKAAENDRTTLLTAVERQAAQPVVSGRFRAAERASQVGRSYAGSALLTGHPIVRDELPFGRNGPLVIVAVGTDSRSIAASQPGINEWPFSSSSNETAGR